MDLHVDRQSPWPGPTVLEWSPAWHLSPCWGIRVCAENQLRCPQLSGSYSTGSSKAGAGQRSMSPGSWARLSQVPPRCPFTVLTPILHLWNQGSEIPMQVGARAKSVLPQLTLPTRSLGVTAATRPPVVLHEPS